MMRFVRVQCQRVLWWIKNTFHYSRRMCDTNLPSQCCTFSCLYWDNAMAYQDASRLLPIFKTLLHGIKYNNKTMLISREFRNHVSIAIIFSSSQFFFKEILNTFILSPLWLGPTFPSILPNPATLFTKLTSGLYLIIHLWLRHLICLSVNQTIIKWLECQFI